MSIVKEVIVGIGVTLGSLSGETDGRPVTLEPPPAPCIGVGGAIPCKVHLPLVMSNEGLLPPEITVEGEEGTTRQERFMEVDPADYFVECDEGWQRYWGIRWYCEEGVINDSRIPAEVGMDVSGKGALCPGDIVQQGDSGILTLLSEASDEMCPDED